MSYRRRNYRILLYTTIGIAGKVVKVPEGSMRIRESSNSLSETPNTSSCRKATAKERLMERSGKL